MSDITILSTPCFLLYSEEYRKRGWKKSLVVVINYYLINPVIIIL